LRETVRGVLPRPSNACNIAYLACGKKCRPIQTPFKLLLAEAICLVTLAAAVGALGKSGKPIALKDGRKIATLGGGRDIVLSLPPLQRREPWRDATELISETAADEDSLPDRRRN
jgi:hypothetical protein